MKNEKKKFNFKFGNLLTKLFDITVKTLILLIDALCAYMMYLMVSTVIIPLVLLTITRIVGVTPDMNNFQLFGLLYCQGALLVLLFAYLIINLLKRIDKCLRSVFIRKESK